MNSKTIMFYIFICFFIHIIASYLSIGFYSDDEHFQILEPVAYLLGLNDIIIEDTTGYYWEWRLHIRMRPWFQPYLYYNFIVLLKFIGIENPFTWTLIIRIISSLLGFVSIIYLFFTFKDDFFKKQSHFNYFIFFGFWFYPFLHARTSSENLSMTFFIISICILYKQLKIIKINYNYFILFIASFLMGLGMIAKFNLVFTAVPFFIWMLIFKFNLKRIIIFGIAVLLALSLGLYIDYINWGSFRNTYLQFYYWNMNEEYGRLNDFGTDPFYYYFTESILQLAPILSVFFIFGLILFWINNYKNAITFITFINLIIISLIGHKEIRYIFPIYVFAPFFVSYFFERFNYKYISNILKILVVISNILFLLITISVPASTKVGAYKYIFENISYDEKIYYLENNPYLVNNMEPFFYTKFLPKINKLDDKTKLKNVWIVSNKHEKINNLPETCNLKYSTYPDFIFKLNENWKRLNLNWYILYCN